MVRTAVGGDDEDPDERLVWSVEEMAARLGISRSFAYEAVQRGDIPHLRIGRRILIPRSALHRLVEGGEGEPS